MILLFIIATITQSSECPHYDNVYEVKDGQDSRIEDKRVYSCKNDFTKRLNTFECQLFIFSCTFKSMQGSSNGGALYLQYDNIDYDPENIIDNCQFIDCKCNSGTVYVDGHNGTSFTFTNCLFENNTASSYGGALYLEHAFATIRECRFINNTGSYGGFTLYFVYKDLNVQKEATLTITDCTFLKNVYTKTSKNGLLYIQTTAGFTIKFTVTSNYIDLTDTPSAFTFICFQTPSQQSSKFAFNDNKILPYESSKFISNINGYKFDLNGEGNAPYQPPIEPEYTIKDHKETDKIENKKEYTGSTEKRVSVLVEQSTFNGFSSEKDGGLFKLKDIEVDFHDNKISNCEAVGGAGGAMYIENTNDVNYRISIKNIQFSNCKADYGGALYVYSTSSYGDILISFCHFSSNTASTKGGGSALYFCSNKGKIKNCEFIDNKGGSALKIVEPSQKSRSIKLASPSQTESISFFNCNFLSNKESKESIYFASKSGSKIIKIVKCNFNGKLAKGINYIDGELADNKQPAIHLYDCKFEKVAVNKKLVVSSTSSLSSKSFFIGKYINVVFMCFAALAFVTFVTFLALKFKKSHQEIQEDDEDDSKTIINESL